MNVSELAYVLLLISCVFVLFDTSLAIGIVLMSFGIAGLMSMIE